MENIKTLQHLLFAFLLLFSNLIFSQNDISQKNDKFEVAKNQHTLDIEAFNIGYSYAHKVSKSALIGMSANLGLGLHFFLSTPKYLEYNPGICDSSGCYYESSKKFLSPTLELFKVQIFYRKYFRQNLQVELGCYYSLGNLPTHYEQSGFIPSNTNIGATFSVFYGSAKIKFGHCIQIGNIHINYYSEGATTNIMSVILTPIKVRFLLGK